MTTTTLPPPITGQVTEDYSNFDTISSKIADLVEASNNQYPSRLIASTGSTYNGSIINSQKNELQDIREQHLNDLEEVQVRLLKRRKLSFENPSERNVFKTVQWTPDGSSLITTSEDDGLRLFVLPPDLLEPRTTPLHLKPYSLSSQPSTIYSSAIVPSFYLQDPSTTLVLTSSPSLPISLTPVLYPYRSFSFPLYSPQTERYLPAYSLLFTPSNPTTFLAGSESQIAVFDISRPGQEPVQIMHTTPSRKAPLNTFRMKGLVSAMACSNWGVLAAGTFGGSLGLYDREGSGSTISTLELPGRESSLGGQGVTSLAWSSCGNYLYVLQRKTNCILIYDFRSTGQMVGVFKGVAAGGNQRISMEVVESWGGQVLVGGDDGWVRVWDKLEGEKSVWGWEVGGDTVTGVGVHSSGSIVATAGGKRWFAPDDDENEDSEDEDESENEDKWGREEAENCLKVWTF